jgi:4'-phosphopantetheinyl transferase
MSPVHVYPLILDEVDCPEARSLCESVLSSEELARRNRFMFERNQREYLFAHGLVRRSLSHHAPSVHPQAWQFCATAHGRPEVSGPPGAPQLRFNLSHTDGMVACVVAAAHEVGVDVEAVDRAAATLELAERFFARPEVRALRALPKQAQRARFFEYWTLKEAYIKARGLGLALSLGQFHFQIDTNSIRIVFAPEFDDRSERWRFLLEQIGSRHLLAVAVGGTADAPQPIIVSPEVARRLILED